MGLLAIGWSGKTSPGFAMEDSGSVTDACADANGDGAVTVSDGVQVLRAAADLSSSCTLFSCDVDGSGSVGLTDGVNVLERAAGFSLGTAYGCPVPSTQHDFSTFARFELSVLGFFPFCAPTGSVFHVVIRRETDDVFDLELSVLTIRPVGDAACVDALGQADDGGCFAVVSQPDRVLSADEVVRVRAAFAAISINEARDPECGAAGAPIKSCQSDVLHWDDTEVSTYRCSERWLSLQTSVNLTVLLDTLIVEPEPTPTP